LLEDLYSQVFKDTGEVKDGVTRPLGDGLPCYAVDGMFVYWDHEPRMPWQTPVYYSSQRSSLRPNTYLRLHENRWVSSESGLFDMDRWDACTDPEHFPPLPDKRISLYVGVDASTKRDRAAVVSVYREGGKVKLGPKRFWQPSAADPLDLEDTMESYLLELHRGYHLLRCNYDPIQFHRSAMTLAKKGLPMQEYPQTVPNLTECGQNLYDLVQGGSIVLYPCKELRKEAVSAIGKETTRGVRIAKEKTSQKIDQIVALAMGAVELKTGAGSFFSGCDMS
jgi:phage terminase large subunit-like protein